jgi:uncharacterized iron-regulated membrane protein
VLPPSVLIQKVKPHFDNYAVSGIDYQGPDKSVVLSHWSETNGKEVHMHAYLNPYTGEVLHVENGHSFFDIIIELHVNLLLGDMGRQIVDYATLIFVILLISGIILWWPKNKSAAKQRFWFKWKEGLKWKRKNYDLHNILGFYSSFVIIFIALTGLAWGFEWMNRSIQFVVSGGDEFKTWEEIYSGSDSLMLPVNNIEDKVYYSSIKSYKEAYNGLSIYLPRDNKSPIDCYVNPSSRSWYTATAYHYDQRTAGLLKIETFDKLSNGAKAQALYYDIHIGKIFGLTGQFIAFFACLIVGSLPITGFYIWYGRKKKKDVRLPENKIINPRPQVIGIR